MKRLGIFIFYNKYGKVNEYVKYLLQEVNKLLDSLIIVCNGCIEETEKKFLEEYSEFVYVRRNEGFDAGAYQDVILNVLGKDKIEEFDELLLFNNSFYGPLYPFTNMFETMGKKQLDFWGITAGGNNRKGKTPYHIQSYFIVISSKILKHDSFWKYWQSQEKCIAFHDAVENFELRLTNYFLGQGFQCGTYIDLEELRTHYDVQGNYLNIMEYELIEKWKCPVLKRKYVMETPKIALQKNSSNILSYLQHYTDYNVDLIWDDIVKEYTPFEVTTRRYLQYFVDPELQVNEFDDIYNQIQVVIYSNFNEIYEKTIREFNTDIVITIIPKDTDEHVNLFNTLKCILDNSNRKTLFGIITDTWIENSSLFECERFCEDIINKLFATKNYISQICYLFLDNKKLGLLLPEEPLNDKSITHIGQDVYLKSEESSILRELEINSNYTIGEKTLKNIGCFWCSQKVLERLFNETLSEGVSEREVFPLLPYIAKDVGLYTGIINNSRTMKKEHAMKAYFMEQYFEYLNKNVIYYDTENINMPRGPVLDFVDRFKGVYIYGAGIYGRRCIEFLLQNKVNILGVVLTECKSQQTYMNYKVTKITDLNLQIDQGIIVAMNKKNQNEVKRNLEKVYEDNIYYI